MKLVHFLPLIFATTSALVFNGTQLPNGEIEGRIGGGQCATRKDFPFNVALVRDNVEAANRLCGGALIDTKWILTTAHCLVGFKGVTVKLGAISIQASIIELYVSKNDFRIHPQYVAKEVRHDIALIKINPVKLSKRVSTVRLPSIARKQKLPYSFACGWGELPSEHYVPSKHLKWAGFTIISNKDCKNVYPTLPDSSICVKTTGGIGGVSPYLGDFGGPLISIDDGTLIGVLSFASAKIIEENLPAVYVRVADYLGWIHQITGLKIA